MYVQYYWYKDDEGKVVYVTSFRDGNYVDSVPYLEKNPACNESVMIIGEQNYG